MMEYIKRNMMIFFKSTYYFIRAIALQIMAALFIYSIGILATKGGILASYIAIFPLALLLGMTLTGQMILFYLFLVVPIIYIFYGYKEASVDWGLSLTNKNLAFNAIADPNLLSDGQLNTNKLESLINSNQHLLQLSKLIGKNEFFQLIKGLKVNGEPEFKPLILDALNNRKLKSARFIKGLALLHGSLIAFGMLLFILN